MEFIADLDGDGTTIAEHPQRINKVKGPRRKGQEVHVSTDEVNSLSRNLFSPDRRLCTHQHFPGQINSHQMRRFFQTMKIPACPTAGVQDGYRPAEGVRDQLKRPREMPMVFRRDVQFVILSIAKMNLSIGGSKTLLNRLKIDPVFRPDLNNAWKCSSMNVCGSLPHLATFLVW